MLSYTFHERRLQRCFVMPALGHVFYVFYRNVVALIAFLGKPFTKERKVRYSACIHQGRSCRAFDGWEKQVCAYHEPDNIHMTGNACLPACALRVFGPFRGVRVA
jgi:hypothetical protein